MGIIRRMIYANLIPERIREAAIIDELKNQRDLLKEMLEVQHDQYEEQLRQSEIRLKDLRGSHRDDEIY